MTSNVVSGEVVDSAVQIHMKFGPGLLESAYQWFMVVEEEVVVELKAIQKLLPVHSAQLLSYMKLQQYRVGLLINFHEPRLVDGLQRLVL